MTSRARILRVLCHSDRCDCLVRVICFYSVVILGDMSNMCDNNL